MSEDPHPSTHPPLPPTTEDDRVSWLRLLRSRRVGPATFLRLLGEHGSADAALAALPEVARAAGVQDYTPCPEAVAMAELRAARAANARMICMGEPGYPTDLQQIPDAPPLLWAIGDPDILKRPMIALVGARNASSLGLRMARALAADLAAEGLVVVSGMARGIDTAAHTATLEAGTVAIMAGGVDVMYPAENTRLAEDIAKTGLRLSEQPMGMAPQARHFPRRNRIISGISKAVVVVEAAAKSGSLITARMALDQGREVLAVPGHPFDARAAGCNMLIRDGALLVRRATDVTEALPAAARPAAAQAEMPLASPAPALPAPPAAPPRDSRSLRDTALLHSRILDRLGPSPLAEDQLIRDLAVPANAVTPVLTDLELDGRIRRQPGGLLSRV
ncbi:MAG: DNA-processing protein DprA [Pseudomonadota bacterium]|uniref:DNA-processing protein DprA n=1 Tax=Roseovarius TaxID=74030 RepID=UPI0022A85D40|nr:DNA-processing protein DprA [Roseovarius sp. EGI FJ00037]MCZ0812689.1 DNA-processing protein DprA [Roseovarius sp. EGI FJ00037]